MKYRIIFRWKYNRIKNLDAKIVFLELLFSACNNPEMREVEGHMIAEPFERLFTGSNDKNDDPDFDDFMVNMQKEFGFNRFLGLAGMLDNNYLARQGLAWREFSCLPELLWDLRSTYKRKLNSLLKKGGTQRYGRLINTRLRLPLYVARKKLMSHYRPQPVAFRRPEALEEHLTRQEVYKQRWFEKISKTTLLIVAAMLALSFGSMVAKAWRGDFFGLVWVSEKYSEIEAPTTDSDSSFVTYTPGWLPEGMVLVEETRDEEQQKQITSFYIKDDLYISLSQAKSLDRTRVDTENTHVSNIKVGDVDVEWIRKNGISHFYWISGETQLNITTNIDGDDSLKIISSMKRSAAE